MKKCFILLVLSIFTFGLVACSGGFYYPYSNFKSEFADLDGRYEEHTELEFIKTSDATEMYLSLDNSSYSYSDVRNYIERGIPVPTNAVNIEEMLNYFDYGYEAHDGLNITAEVSTCPWNTKNLLETIAIYAPLTGERLPSNLTFLVDVSGSMSGDDRLGLFQSAFEAALPYFTKDDKVSIVTYASDCSVVLDGESGENKTEILNKIQGLQSGGSTHGSRGIQKAYEVTHKNFIKDGNNHIFIVTDGDFNVGITSEESLGKYVRNYANEGIYLSIFGVGMGNTKQSVIETIKKNGEGNCYYLDSLKEATKALEQALKGGMSVLTKDTKAMITFDPEFVQSFRILGYENKLLTEEEYEDDETNAGEIFEGYQVLIAFEIVPTEKMSDTISTIEIKYKDYKTLENKVASATSKTSQSDMHIFASLVCEFGLILRDSAYKADATFDNIIARASDIKNYLEKDSAKMDFIELVQKAKDNTSKVDFTDHYYN